MIVARILHDCWTIFNNRSTIDYQSSTIV